MVKSNGRIYSWVNSDYESFQEGDDNIRFYFLLLAFETSFQILTE